MILGHVLVVRHSRIRPQISNCHQTIERELEYNVTHELLTHLKLTPDITKCH